MAQATRNSASNSRLPLAVLGAMAGLGLIGAGSLAAMSFFGSPTPTESVLVPAPPAEPAPPRVVITYEVTGKGLFLANGAGETIGTTTMDHLHAEGHVASPVESAPSPDGKWVANIVRNTTGVFLALKGSDGPEKVVTQLAGTEDPALVAGGKGHARAVAGVPLVVAWSPDSKSLAFGSITGEPYALGILRCPDCSQPAISYSQVSGGYVGELAWSPDGNQLAVSTYAMDRLTHTVLIADARTGYATKLIDGCHITWSPDSSYVAVHRDPGAEPGAWVISAKDVADRWAITREVQAFPLTWRES